MNFPVRNIRFFLAILFLGFGAIIVTPCGVVGKGVRGGTGPSSKLTSISVTPANPSIPVGTTQQFAASGTYSDKTSRDIATQVTWDSSNPSVPTVNDRGLVTTIAAGTATITATSGTVSGSQTLTVTSLLSSISVTPTNPSMPAGSYRLFTATGTYSDGTSEVLRTQGTWNSSDTTVVTVTYGGLVAAVAPGIATITVTQGSISGHTTVTVIPWILSAISVTHANPTVPVGITQQFRATGIYSGGIIDITMQVTWSSSNPSVATVNDRGLVTSIAAGTATITATSGSISGDTVLTVASPLFSIVVTPANPSMPEGVTRQFTATGTYSDGTSHRIATQVTWSSSNPSVATVSSSGVVTAVAAGTATITATSGTISGNTTLTAILK